MNKVAVFAKTGIVAIAIMMSACGGSSSGPGAAVATSTPATAASPTPSSPTPVATTTFADVTAGSGISYQTGYVIPPENPFVERLATSAAAAGDYDNDGDIDLFIVRGDIGPNLLYRNDGNLAFQDVAASAGLTVPKSTKEN